MTIPITTIIQSNSCIDGEWFDSINQQIIDCNNICISGNDNEDLNGEYIWQQFDYESNTSIYQCETCTTQMYLYSSVDSKWWANWYISNDYTQTAMSERYCGYSPDVNKIVTATDCMTWETWDNDAGQMAEINMDLSFCQTDIMTIPITTIIQSNSCIDGEWFDSINQQIIDCNNICISGNDNQDLNGEYVWQQFDYQSNTSIYQCETCTGQMYLYSSVDKKWW
eukprot:1773_1